MRRLHAQPLPPAAGCDIRGPRDEAQMLTTQLENVIWRAPAVYAAIGEEGAWRSTARGRCVRRRGGSSTATSTSTEHC